ncbi:ATP-binding cassette domain-containing protein [Arthrobacter sp. JZ12]|uniref:ABC transporter ATP-binding protein n=1 Tax=Arthrobacter sp. JZ12 TaxID=2654190 RepID=UPI002B4863B9|nr:ABC transporter ATP-binding protein [Arthrobacter sp. JZ12]WRH25883.1 ATP-binding cassette domain-containing protein [Arthrobacter sp. JZ12]
MGVSVTARGWGWRHSGRSRWAVRDVDLSIGEGERVLLLGASGAGKSTLLHGLAGVLGEQEEGEQAGELAVDGARPAAARGRSGLVLQDPDTQLVLARVGDEVAFGAENLAVPRDEIWPRVHRALGDVGLEVPLNHPTTALSGGQKQRLALAAVLAMQPGLLLLDEPTANLDPAGVLEVRDAVVRVLDRTSATLVVVEHRVDVWAGVVDRVVVLDSDGGILADGKPGVVLHQEATRARLIEAGVWVPGHSPLSTAGPAAQSGLAGDSEDLLQASGLSVARRRRGAAVLDGVDLTLRRGESLSVLGPNGAGKSTLALTLAGLLQPRGGELSALEPLARGAGNRPHRWKSADLVDRIGTVFQEPEHQFLTPSVVEELEFGPRRVARLPEEEVRRRVDPLVERLRLTGLLKANPFTLSGGEKRRLSVATMLATQPDLLILDEPTFGQDANTWAELVGLLAELISSGTCVVSVTHDRDFTSALGSRILAVNGTGARVGAAA